MFKERAWDLVAVGAGLAAGALARRLVKKGWRGVGGREPPTDRHEPSVDWSEAVAWSVVSGVAVGASRLLVRRAIERRRDAAG